jgi:Tol biopolymer transport system component
VTWSPDGRRLAFSGRRTQWTPRDGRRLSPPRDVFVVSAGGHGLRRVTSAPGDEFSPSWD